MAVTLKQISELAGVSIGTVDRALNNRGRINPEVKKRILEIAKALDYTPNIVAKSLATRKKNLKIGFIIHVKWNDFHDALIKGVQQAAEEIHDFGIEVVVRETYDFSVSDQLRLIDELLTENISALALVPINDYRISERLKHLQQNNIPIVFAGGYIENINCLCHVGHDHALQGRIVANLFDLVTNGPTKLIVFSPSLNMLGHVKILDSLSACLKEEYPRITVEEIVELGNDEIYNYNIVKKTLYQHPDINAVFFSSAVITGGLRALEEVYEEGTVRTITTFNSETVRKAILNDQVCAAVWYNHKEVGYRSIMVLFEYLTSEQVPRNNKVYVEHHILLKQNIINYEELSCDT